jgi:colanic acid/amylovoran biosynthesis glycosyltransferase
MDLYTHPAYLAEKMAYADNIFLVCEFNRRYIREHFPEVYPQVADRIRIHNLGLDLAEVPFSADRAAEPTVVAVGRLEELKGFGILLEAIALVRGRGHPVRLELVGGGEQEQELRARAAELGLADAVTFRGWVQPDEVLAAMRRATILAHTPVQLDAMPTVVKEAMAVGTPVIGSDLAGIPEMLDHGGCGVLVPPRDAGALAAAIERLLADPALRRRYAEAGRRQVEVSYDLARNGRRLAELLRDSRLRPGAG